jgi:nitrogen PTS system EIIA component
MDLKIDDVAQLLNVTPARIEEWLTAGKIPSYNLGDEARFSRQEIEDWMLEQHGLPNDELVGSTGHHKYSLFRALHKGELYNDIPGTTKQELISGTTERLAKKYQLDAKGLASLLMDRERQMPTALCCGIAVPHTRDFLLPTHYDVVTVVFPEKPIDYDALDGQPVHTLFFLFACEDARHLDLLAKIAHFSNDEQNLRLLERRPDRQTLLSHIKAWEAQLAI